MNILKHKNLIFIGILSLLLLIHIFKCSPSIEGFQEKESSQTTHNVELPLTTTISCKNMCGPSARCYITGQQCLSDIDCPGCQPNSKPDDIPSDQIVIPGQNDAGKLTPGVTPNYSTLTTDIGTQAKLITDNKFDKPDMPNFGLDTWSSKFNTDDKKFDDRYKPSQETNMPTYPDRYSLTGQFIEEGPLQSNAYFR